MFPSIPSYIARTGIVDEPVTLDQHAPDLLECCGHGSNKVGRKIDEITDRGIIAFSAGVAEWVAWRFKKHTDVTALFQIIEAAWASVIDWRYKFPTDTRENRLLETDWQGSVRRPVYMAFKLLDGAIDYARRGKASFQEAACLSEIPVHTLRNPEPYKEWRRFVIRRFAKLYPDSSDDIQGPPVPREALDPDVDFQSHMAPTLLANFLKNVDYTANPFLRSPKEMIQAEFEGTPYRC